MSGVDHVLAVLRPRREKRAELLAGEGAVPVHLGDLYTESGHTLQGSFSAVSKQASKQASTFGPKKRNETQTSARNLNATDPILPVL